MVHSYIKFKTDSKKLQFGADKCKKLHIGKYCEDHKCQQLFVDNWEEIEVKNIDGTYGIDDLCDGEQKMEIKEEEKYLGDVISKDGRNIKNIKVRINKGKGIVAQIMTLLEGIPFGQFYFEVGIILRNSLLVSSMLFNSEAWYNITNSEMELLESVDLMLLRSILKVPKSTPKEMLYLELGCVPFRELIRKRRLLFLFYIVNQNPGSLIYKFYEAQMNKRTPKDWISSVLKDKIKEIKKGTYIKMIKQRIEEKTKRLVTQK